MASKVIKGLTVEIGGDTTKLGKALENVENKSASLSKELGEINRMLKFDPKNTELLAQKQKVLADAVTETSKKLDTLKEAERQVQAQFERGEVSEEQVRALQREIIATEGKLNSYKKAAQETADQIEELGKESAEAGKDVGKVGDNAEDAEEGVSELDTAIAQIGTGFGVLVGAIVAASAALVALTEESREYRREMGKLETAFADNNHSAETAQKTYEELVGVLGETDQAVEAANHLANMAETEEDLNTWTSILTGAYAKFGASLPVEGLAEAAAEVAKTGTLTGGLTDAINWAADSTERFGVELKANTEANEDWNKRVEEATTAEEFFQLALEECADEQERQALITDTLNGLFADAADSYKKTNKSVIEANKANDKWNKTLAKTGEKFDPVLTDIKVFGATLVEDMEEPIGDVIDLISKNLLPTLMGISNWVKQNMPTIKANLVGITAAFVAYKVAVIAAEVAHKGLKGAIMATEIAQKALNAVMNMNPYALAAAAIVALVAGAIAYTKEMENWVEKNSQLTESQQELVDKVNATTEAIKSQDEAFSANADGIVSQTNHTKKLADELFRLADENGKVGEADQARVNFILNELNNAYDTEYRMIDGVIQQYGALKKSIYDAIEAKKANLLLEANQEQYITALREEEKAATTVKEAHDNLVAAKKAAMDYEASRLDELKLAQQEYDNAVKYGDGMSQVFFGFKLQRIKDEIAAEWEKVNKLDEGYTTAVNNLQEYTSDVERYEAAQTAILEENYEEAVRILTGKEQAYVDYHDVVDAETAGVLDTLRNEAIIAGEKAAETKKNFENGVEGYTQKMVQEANKEYAAAMGEFESAYTDAFGVGDDLGEGLKEGMEGKRTGLLAKAKSIVQGIIATFRKEADSHSPSRKMIAFGHDLDDGVQIGMEEGTKGILQTAQDQVKGILDRYEGTDKAVNDSIQRGFVAQTASSQAQSARIAANNATMLDKILNAIEAGQIIALDGDKVVGGTYSRMNNKLGQELILAGRGAK